LSESQSFVCHFQFLIPKMFRVIHYWYPFVFCLLAQVAFPQPMTVPPVREGKVAPFQGRPTIFINNQPQAPMFYALTHAYGGRWSWEEVASRNLNNFCGTGIRLFQVDLYLEDIWLPGQDTLDMARARRQVGGVLDQCPDAAVVIRIHVNAPFWWNKAHPEERTEFADGPVQEELQSGPPYHNEQFDVMRPLRASLASERWKREAGEKLVEFCRKLSASPEGNAVAGMHISGGIYGEWHYWGFIDHDPDTGPAMTRYFRQWLRNKYRTDAALQKAWRSRQFTLATATVPGTTERLRTHDGAFKDPSLDRRVIDYFVAQQQVVADDIIYFCRLAKENWPRPLLTGVFYGYLHMTFNRQTVGGHLFLQPILDSPYIDYLSAPQTYWGDSRKVGGSGNSRGIIESTLLHGKLWLDEYDNGYLHADHAADPVHYTERYDPVYHSVLKRSSLLPLMRGSGLWYYDFGVQKGFGWWDNPRYLETITGLKKLGDSHMNQPYQSVADVLYVWSQEVFYYLKSGWLPISSNVLDKSVEEALRSGTASDHIYDFDLDNVDLKPYKAVVFMNVYKLDEMQKKFIREKVARDGRTLVWNYLTGFTDGKQLNLNFVQQLTGIAMQRTATPPKAQQVRFGQPAYEYTFAAPVAPSVVITDPKAEPLARLADGGATVIARKQFPTHTSVFCALPLNGTDGFRAIFRQAGCHVYNDQNDFTYASGNLLLLHASEGGKRQIRLRGGRELSLTLPPASTYLLDSQTGEVLMK
jgi:hypothetical protein